VEEQQGLPLARGEIPQPRPASLSEPLLETRQLDLCVCHRWRLSFRV